MVSIKKDEHERLKANESKLQELQDKLNKLTDSMKNLLLQALDDDEVVSKLEDVLGDFITDKARDEADSAVDDLSVSR